MRYIWCHPETLVMVVAEKKRGKWRLIGVSVPTYSMGELSITPNIDTAIQHFETLIGKPLIRDAFVPRILHDDEILALECVPFRL